jgi:hypothetical protein
MPILGFPQVFCGFFGVLSQFEHKSRYFSGLSLGQRLRTRRISPAKPHRKGKMRGFFAYGSE